MTDDQHLIADLGATIDGAKWHEAVIHLGKQGHVHTRHGAPDRWGWGLTATTLDQALQRHERMVQLAKSLTPDQVAALYTTSDPRAAALRKVLR